MNGHGTILRIDIEETTSLFMHAKESCKILKKCADKFMKWFLTWVYDIYVLIFTQNFFVLNYVSFLFSISTSKKNKYFTYTDIQYLCFNIFVIWERSISFSKEIK